MPEHEVGRNRSPPPPHGSHASPDSGKGLLCAARKGLFRSSFDLFMNPDHDHGGLKSSILLLAGSQLSQRAEGVRGKTRNSLFDVLYLFG